MTFLSHPACSSGFIQVFLDHYAALKNKRWYLLTCKVRNGSRLMIGSNVGSMMHMSCDSPFIA